MVCSTHTCGSSVSAFHARRRGAMSRMRGWLLRPFICRVCALGKVFSHFTIRESHYSLNYAAQLMSHREQQISIFPVSLWALCLCGYSAFALLCSCGISMP